MDMNYNPWSLVGSSVAPSKSIAYVDEKIAIISSIAKDFEEAQLDRSQRGWKCSEQGKQIRPFYKKIRKTEMLEFLPPANGEVCLQWYAMRVEIGIDLIIICPDPEADMQ